MAGKTQTDYVLGRFDSIAEASSITGIAEHSWRNWQRAGRISPKKHTQIILRGRAAGKDIGPPDFYAHLVDELIAHAASHAAAQLSTNEARGTVPQAVAPAA